MVPGVRTRDALPPARDLASGFGRVRQRRIDLGGEIDRIVGAEGRPGLADHLADGGDVGAEHRCAGRPSLEEDVRHAFELRCVDDCDALPD